MEIMMKPENAIEVINVTKKFRVYTDKGYTLKEKTLFRRRRSYEERVVLDGISFTVKKGEAVGLIGHNGCGKSTTLKLLTKIMYPDGGTIAMCGRVSSLIELGAGFHPDLSGRENVYINASVFGLSKKEIERRMDAIIAFSELEEFIDHPVRTYSSGMYMRLAFAVAIHVEANILLIDEILAVGDAGFQAKCFHKLRELKAGGVTIVIVSHSLAQIEQFCDRCIWVDLGKVRMEGKPEKVNDVYLDDMGKRQKNEVFKGPDANEKNNDEANDKNANIEKRNKGREFEMNIYDIVMKTEAEEMEFSQEDDRFFISVYIKNNSSLDLISANDLYLSYHLFSEDGSEVQWDNERFEIQLLRGEEGTVNIYGMLPAKEGTYILRPDIVKEGVAWYSNQGLRIPSVTLKILKNVSVLANHLKEEIAWQKKVEDEWRAILASEQYDFYYPYVKLDPYGRAPLSAVLIFTSDEAMSVELDIQGKSAKACVHAQFQEYTTKHIIPVYGLYPDVVNKVRIKGRKRKYSKESVVENTIEISTEKLKGDLQNISLITYSSDENRYASGFNFCYTGLEFRGTKMAYDINGDIRWYFSDCFFETTNYVSNASVWVTKQDAQSVHYQKDALIYEYNMLGRIQSVYRSPYGIHHDLQFTAEDTIVILGNSKEVRHDKLIEIDRETGKILHVVDYKKMLQRTRNVSVVYSNADWLHINAVVEHHGDFIVSGNTQSTIVKHDREGNIKWMFGDPAGYGTYWKQFFLKPEGSDFDYFYNQHAIEILPDPDGSSDTFDLLMFDNGYSRNKCRQLDEKEHSLYSRMVQYRINEKTKTFRQIWEYGKERPELFSKWRGDADQQENGNLIGVFNVRQQNEMDGKKYMECCFVVEVDRKKNVVWESYGCSKTARNSYTNYRVKRMEFYGNSEKYIDLSRKIKIRLEGNL